MTDLVMRRLSWLFGWAHIITRVLTRDRKEDQSM